MSRWWEDERFDVMDTVAWRARYCVLGFTLLSFMLIPAYLHAPHWRIWIAVAGVAYALWVFSVFAIMARRTRLDQKARRAERDEL